MIGSKFGRLVVVSAPLRNPRNQVCVECLCQCGKTVVVRLCHLKSGASASCGCLRKEIMSVSKRTHGLTKTSEYKTFIDMKNRCTNTNAAGYKNYGGRGICVEWLCFEDFVADMGNRPSAKHYIDRIDNDGNYSSSNCRWSTRTENNRNRRNTIVLTFDGVTLPVVQMAERVGISYCALRSRIARGWPTDKACAQRQRPSCVKPLI